MGLVAGERRAAFCARPGFRHALRVQLASCRDAVPPPCGPGRAAARRVQAFQPDQTPGMVQAADPRPTYLQVPPIQPAMAAFHQMDWVHVRSRAPMEFESDTGVSVGELPSWILRMI